MKKDKLTPIFVSTGFKKKLMYESKVVRGITMADYTRMLAASDEDVKTLLNKKETKQDKEKKRSFNFGF